jgi:hypothetical protein
MSLRETFEVLPGQPLTTRLAFKHVITFALRQSDNNLALECRWKALYISQHRIAVSDSDLNAAKLRDLFKRHANSTDSESARAN